MCHYLSFPSLPPSLPPSFPPPPSFPADKCQIITIVVLIVILLIVIVFFFIPFWTHLFHSHMVIFNIQRVHWVWLLCHITIISFCVLNIILFVCLLWDTMWLSLNVSAPCAVRHALHVHLVSIDVTFTFNYAHAQYRIAFEKLEGVARADEARRKKPSSYTTHSEPSLCR